MIPVNVILLCLCCAWPLFAKGKDDFQQKAHISANRQEVMLNDQILTFWDDVEIKQGSIRISAQKVIIRPHPDDDSQWLEAFGTPATFSQILDNDQPLFARAQVIRYNIQTKSVYLEHDAFVQQPDGQVTGEYIHYHVNSGKIEARSTDKEGRVQSIFSFKPKPDS